MRVAAPVILFSFVKLPAEKCPRLSRNPCSPSRRWKLIESHSQSRREEQREKEGAGREAPFRFICTRPQCCEVPGQENRVACFFPHAIAQVRQDSRQFTPQQPDALP
ncbi:unnamed protein product [Hapterophycus canaliculatus]